MHFCEYILAWFAFVSSVEEISFLSKLRYFLFWFVLKVPQFWRNEICVTVFLKWTDFSPFCGINLVCSIHISVKGNKKRKDLNFWLSFGLILKDKRRISYFLSNATGRTARHSSDVSLGLTVWWFVGRQALTSFKLNATLFSFVKICKNHFWRRIHFDRGLVSAVKFGQQDISVS